MQNILYNILIFPKSVSLHNKIFFEETTPGVFVIMRNKIFGLKNNWWASAQYKEKSTTKILF